MRDRRTRAGRGGGRQCSDGVDPDGSGRCERDRWRGHGGDHGDVIGNGRKHGAALVVGGLGADRISFRDRGSPRHRIGRDQIGADQISIDVEGDPATSCARDEPVGVGGGGGNRHTLIGRQRGTGSRRGHRYDRHSITDDSGNDGDIRGRRIERDRAIAARRARDQGVRAGRETVRGGKNEGATVGGLRHGRTKVGTIKAKLNVAHD